MGIFPDTEPKKPLKRTANDRPSEAFVERTSATGTPRPARISLQLDENGAVNFDALSEKTREKLASAIKNTPEAGSKLGLNSLPSVQASIYEVSEEHVKRFLDLYAMAERFVIPAQIEKAVEKKTLGAFKPKFTDEMKEQIFSFSDEEKNFLAPDGALWANTSLPEWLKKFLFETIGPGSRFFGGLALISYNHMKLGAKLLVEGGAAPAEKANGVAKPEEKPGEVPGGAVFTNPGEANKVN